MIDATSEQLIPVKQVPGHLPGNRVHHATVWRWVLTGIRGCKLETILVGGRRYTSQDAIARFIEQTTAASAGMPIPTRTAKQRKKAIEAAERELAAAGI